MDGLKPGRIVYFVFSQTDVDSVHTGNRPSVGDIVPAMVVQVWNATIGYVNLKVILDGPDTLWVTSVSYSAEKTPRSWHWMYEGQATRGEAK